MDRLERYEQYRDVGQQLHTKLADRYLDRERIMDTASILRIETDGDDIEYATELEFMAHLEYLLYEYPIDGQAAIERYRSTVGGETPIEEALLSAMSDSRTSLFRVQETDPADGTVKVADLLEDVPDIKLIDRRFAESASPDLSVFLRMLQLDDLAMTSGLVFGFPAGEEAELASVYEEVLERTSRPDAQARFVTFYRLYRERGVETRMASASDG